MVVAQLVEQSLPIPEVQGHRQKFILNIYCQLYWKDENKEKEARNCPFFKKGNNDVTIGDYLFQVCSPTAVVYTWTPAVWPDLPIFHHFGKSLPVFGKFLTVHFILGKILSWLWQIWDIIGLIFTIANGQIFKNNLTIWSHWRRPKTCTFCASRAKANAVKIVFERKIRKDAQCGFTTTLTNLIKPLWA